MKIKWNWALSAFIFLNAVFTYVLIEYFSNLKYGMAIMAAPALIIYILVTCIILIAWAIKKRKQWFKPELAFSSITMLGVCLSAPIIVIWLLANPARTTNIETKRIGDNQFLKTEEEFYKEQIISLKYWKRYEENGDLLKDSTWVILNHSGDTVSIKKYSRGVLNFEYKFN